MGYAAYIGRVGALAVALGVGVAVAHNAGGGVGRANGSGFVDDGFDLDVTDRRYALDG